MIPRLSDEELDEAEDRIVTDCPDSYGFLDHTGSTAVSAYHGCRASVDSKHILPPLWSYHVYATFDQPDILGIAKLIDSLTLTVMNECFSYRIDSYQMPGASLSSCMEHYEEEKSSRRHTARAMPNYMHRRPHYLVYLDRPDFEQSGATVVAWNTTSDMRRQDRVPLGSASTSAYGDFGEDGFVYTEDVRYPERSIGSLGHALLSLYPLRCEDDDYSYALYAGFEQWDETTPFERDELSSFKDYY